jgi:hypothetical protein
MSIIKNPLLFVGSKGEKHLYTLFNSGATLSCINLKHALELGVIENLGIPRILGTAFEGHVVKITQRIALDFYIDGVLLSDEFLLVPGLSEEAIIGAATMQKWRIKLDFEHDCAIVDPKVAKMQLV